MQREREREVKVTEAQKLVIIDFMEQNEDFAKGKLLTAESKKIWAGLWETLTVKLNNMNGAQKSTTKWQRAWSDLKNKVKRKAKDIRQLRSRAEWPQPNLKLTNFEERLISFVADEIVYGIKVFENENIMDIEDPLSNDTENISSPLNVMSSHIKIEEIKPEMTEEIIFADSVNYCTSPSTSIPNKDNDIDIHEEKISNFTSSENTDEASQENVDRSESSKVEEGLNKKIENLADIGKELIKEHRRTNDILNELVTVLKQNNNKLY